MTLVFGSSTSSLNDYAVGNGNPQQFTDKIDHLVLYFVYLFIARFVIGYVATLCICIAAARTTRSLRKAFLESLLRQEVSHFDTQGNGSAATQVTTSEYIPVSPSCWLTGLFQMASKSIKALPRNYTPSYRAYRYSSRPTLSHSPYNGSLPSLP